MVAGAAAIGRSALDAQLSPHLTGKRGAQAAARPMSLPGQLDEAGFGDIAIRPLAVTCDGVTFGLIHESGPDRGSRAGLYPDRLGFSDPWDGTYSRQPAPACATPATAHKIVGIRARCR
jgi:hypothetical protein